MFTQILTDLRKQKRLTQKEMAKILGVARTTYSSYEQGRRMPDSNVQIAIADFFGVTLDYLHGRSKPKEKVPSLVSANLLENIGEEDLEDILRYIEFRKNNPLGNKI